MEKEFNKDSYEQTPTELSTLNNKQACTNCGQKILVTLRFCKTCGNRINTNGLCIKNSNKKSQCKIYLEKLTKSEEYYSNGLELEDMGDLSNSLKFYNEALNYNPSFSEALTRRAWVHEMLGNQEQAIEDYRTAISLTPNNVENYISCGATHANLHNYEQAMEYYNAALKLKPNNAKPYYNMAMIHLNDGKLEKAVEDLTTSLQYEDGFYLLTYLNRGIALLELNKPKQALADFYYILQKDPSYTDAYYWRGSTYLKLKLYTKAVNDLNEILKVYKYSEQALQKRGTAHMQLQNFKLAIDDFIIAHELNPESEINNYNLALMRFKLKDLKPALDDFENLIKKNTNKPEYHFYHASIKKELGGFPKEDIYKGFNSAYILSICTNNYDLANLSLQNLKACQ